MITIYHNNRCTKSRCALQELEKSGKAFEVVYYLDTPPNKAELTAIVAKLGIKPLKLIRKGEAVFVENYKGKTLTDEEWIEAMVKHPILIERPIVISGDQAVIARPTEKIQEILG
ncbi:arsenate reductase (glutaredoxin) [Pedobacter sp. HDW13]|uniref:arsenate reductase (glutaredoxin) n=1 Tax=unclassified Pedobacter TaxID=2628915 RepID=UPI000F5A6531|nr:MULTISPECIES: arsenate reductase (glutaredoxin) [unclassified Pedobacter]QIL41264.1 arsenate reductase (glutaredoxin) [Pedobacter sp. HDW13]RQO77118.1 arsenate reductase (glutaredoxin) [Pedobacter sp. KBW01]